MILRNIFGFIIEPTKRPTNQRLMRAATAKVALVAQAAPLIPIIGVNTISKITLATKPRPMVTIGIRVFPSPCKTAAVTCCKPMKIMVKDMTAITGPA